MSVMSGIYNVHTMLNVNSTPVFRWLLLITSEIVFIPLQFWDYYKILDQSNAMKISAPTTMFCFMLKFHHISHTTRDPNSME